MAGGRREETHTTGGNLVLQLTLGAASCGRDRVRVRLFGILLGNDCA